MRVGPPKLANQSFSFKIRSLGFQSLSNFPVISKLNESTKYAFELSLVLVMDAYLRYSYA